MKKIKDEMIGFITWSFKFAFMIDQNRNIT